MTSEDIKNRKWTKAELDAVRRASAAQKAGLELPEAEYEDIPRLTPEQLAGMVRLRDVRKKVPVSVRLDPEVLEWLRSKGEGHLTRINDILTNLMEAERRMGSGKLWQTVVWSHSSRDKAAMSEAQTVKSESMSGPPAT